MLEQEIDWARPIVIDFETYYDKDYSLSKITTEEYIRSEKFECIGLSIKLGDHPTEFYKGEFGLEILKYALKMTHPNSPVVSHNNTFDMGILGLRYNIHPKFMVDTAIMAKLCALDRVAGGSSLARLSAELERQGIYSQIKGDKVHDMLGKHISDMTELDWEEYGDYCKLDTDLCYVLYKYMLDKVPLSELQMADITTKMWTKPVVELDQALLAQYLLDLDAERTAKLQNAADKVGVKDLDELQSILRSRTKFPLLLEKLGVPVPMKISPTTGKPTPATSKTDQAMLDLLEHPDETVRVVVETKLGTASSLARTRAETMLGIASRGLMPIPLRYASAHTGRYGGCFVADTKVLCLSHDGEVVERCIVDVRKDDLVWDGVEWCKHGGVEFNGYQEVISYDGLTGTKQHRVFLDETTETTLFDAMRTGAKIMDCPKPHGW